MRKYVFLILLVITALRISPREVYPVPKLPFNPLRYYCYQVQDTIRIDGKLDDKDWQYDSNLPDWLQVPWTADFVDIEGELKPLPDQRTRVKMLWDQNGLYIGAELEEEHIWAKLTERDAIVFYDNDFEIFIDPNGDTHNYYELEINALGTLWDLFITAPYYRAREWPALYSWDARNIRYAIDIDGTINDPKDIDKKWTIEMLIPWSDIKDQAHTDVPPKVFDCWRINFSRVQWQTDIIDGKYVKKEGVPESNWVWSPQGLIAMHYPERWGIVQFLNRPGAKYDLAPGVVMDPSWILPAKEYLYQLFYKQKQYWFDHQKYAKTLEELQAEPFTWPNWDTRDCKVTIETTSQSFIITLHLNNKSKGMHINETGLTWTDK
jgi:hypothetical protein